MTWGMAEARGRVTIRPWRVGQLVDTESAAEVREAIANLSSVWGGMFMPIFDIHRPIETLERLGELHDVDSLYADVEDGPLADFLRSPGWAWRGRGAWGPFGDDANGSLRKGLLPTRALLEPSTRLVIPTWDPGDPAGLVFAARWGLPHVLHERVDREVTSEVHPIRHLDSRGLSSGGARVGALAAGRIHLTLARYHRDPSDDGVVVIRPDHPEEIVSFWNMRALGSHAVPIPADADGALARILLAGELPTQKWGTPEGQETVLPVIGLDHALAGVTEVIHDVASELGASVRPHSPTSRWPSRFPGLTTRFERSIRATFRRDAPYLDISLPELPLVDASGVGRLARGIVAAEVGLRDVERQDPRFTTEVPPYRRHSSLIERRWHAESVDHFRAGYEGVVLGLDAHVEDVRVPFASNLDVMRLLFDDEDAIVEQSDVGKFQSRAAEKFGGPFSGVFSQPGVRGAVTLAAARPTGVTLQHLRQIVENERGGWPDPLMSSQTTPKAYATRVVNELLNAGLFVPTLRVQCSQCRVESHVSADELATTMHCEFCGQPYNLALSHSISKPEWRYRLAAHLRADQVEALLPALATTTVLRLLRQTYEPLPLVLGFTITLGGKAVEADVAAYLADNEWVAVLGEVKSGNRVDGNDVRNLEFLREKLHAKNVRSVLLFATLKDRFSVEEVAELRTLVQRTRGVQTAHGPFVPNLPLVLTGPDLSHTPWDEDHPWRWATKPQAGIYDTARISCERNLGLIGYGSSTNEDGVVFTFEWKNSPEQVLSHAHRPRCHVESQDIVDGSAS